MRSTWMRRVARRLQQIFWLKTLSFPNKLDCSVFWTLGWHQIRDVLCLSPQFLLNVGVLGHDRFEKFTRTGESLAKWTGVCWKIGSEDSAALEVSDGGRTPLEARPGTDERDNSIGRAQYKEHRFYAGCWQRWQEFLVSATIGPSLWQ